MPETTTEDFYRAHMGGLPDPDRDAQFYEGVAVRRFLAFLFDFAFEIALTILFALVFGILTLGVAFFFVPAIWVVTSFCYRTLTLGSGRSATWGMRLFGIEIRDGAGDRFSLPQGAAHTILFQVAMAFFLAQIVSIIMMAGTRYGHGLHDLPLGSTAINTPH